MITEILGKNPSIKNKIIKSQADTSPKAEKKKQGSVMFLVGEILKETNRQGDPLEIE